MVKEEAVKSVLCPGCGAEPGSDCTDVAGYTTNTHVARRRRWRIENVDRSKNTP